MTFSAYRLMFPGSARFGRQISMKARSPGPKDRNLPGEVRHLMSEELPYQSPAWSSAAELLALAKFTRVFAIDARSTRGLATPRCLREIYFRSGSSRDGP